MARSKVEQVKPSPRGEAKNRGGKAFPQTTNACGRASGFGKHLLRAFLLYLLFLLKAAAHPPQGTKLSPKKAQATAMHLVI